MAESRVYLTGKIDALRGVGMSHEANVIEHDVARIEELAEKWRLVLRIDVIPSSAVLE